MISFKLIFFSVAAFCFVQNAVSRIIVVDVNGPPPFYERAKMARYVVHKADWTSIGTISTQKGITGYPFVGLKSVSDGPDGEASGIPYMLMTTMDVSMIDLEANNKCTLFFSLAQGDFCKTKQYDPQDPRCARIMLTGSVEKVSTDSKEYTFAKRALMGRHPAMAKWPTDHNFFIAKVNIIQIAVLDFFGGIEYVSVKDYMDADINSYSRYYDNDWDNLQSIEVKLLY